MVDLVSSPTAQIIVLLFYWVPFALAAYLVEQWRPERTRRSLQKLLHPTRHIAPGRHAPA